MSLTCCKALAANLPDPVRKSAFAGAVVRHGACWAMGGFNPLSLMLHVAAVAYVYPEEMGVESEDDE